MSGLIEPVAIERYLRERAGLALTVKAVSKLPRGVSRETWVIDAVDDAGVEYELALRRDMPSGSICFTSLRFEYEVYERIGRTDLPVARVIRYEEDPEWMVGGRAFFLRWSVAGSWQIPNFHNPDPSYDAMRIEAGREHIRALARLHTLDWAALGFCDVMSVPRDAADCAGQLIDELLESIDELRREPLPLVTAVAAWLRRNRPTSVGRIALIKGTNGYGEEVFRDGRIVAMSDWELARIGDPALDWAQIQDMIGDVHEGGELVWGLQPALDYYRELTGLSIDPVSIDYYRKLYGLYLVLMSQSAGSKLAGGDPSCRLAWVSSEILFRGQAVLASAIGVGEASRPVPGQLG